MQMKLSYKIFLTFLLTFLTIVVLMVVIMQFYAYRNFTEYVLKIEILRHNELVTLLGEEYQRNNGWESLRNNNRRWWHILRPRPFTSDSTKPPPLPSGFATYTPPPPPPPPPPDERNRERERGPRRRPPEEHLLRDGRKRGPPPPFRIEHRLTLFDAQKQPVVGAFVSTEDNTLREITVGDNIVGWLGLKKEERLSQPLDIAFIKQQSQAFYTIGGLMLALAAIVAFILSRHLLAPVQQLTKGTQALTSRNFHTRINVHTADELGQLAADFNVMAQTLEKYENMRQQWVSDISHELRTPLSILQGEIEALQDGVRDLNQKTLDSLHSEVLHLSQIVNDLHDLSLAETGTLHFEREPVNPLHVLRETIRKFQNRFVQQHITLVDDLGDIQNITLMGDKNRLAQLFSNLLENTLRYTDPPGTLKIWKISTKTHVSLNFEDTKPGVPEGSLARLFDRLYRVDPSRNRTKGSSGLGLAICKNIVETHGGKIKAANAPSGGLRIEIVFPLKKI